MSNFYMIYIGFSLTLLAHCQLTCILTSPCLAVLLLQCTLLCIANSHPAIAGQHNV